MKRNMIYGLVFAVFVGLSLSGFPVDAQEQTAYKVLVVMTYHEGFFWNQDIKAGIEAVLAETSELKYGYLAVLNDTDSVDAKVQEAYALYQEWQPDGVITADDDAQSRFVVPFLQDKVNTPVIFCGVNAPPEQYGFPSANVSGILQRPHVAETIMFVRQLAPSIKTIGVLSLDIPAGRALSQQIQQVLETHYVKTLAEALVAAEALKSESDALFMWPLGALIDADGNTLGDKDVYPVLAKVFGKPTLTIWGQIVPFDVLCAITDRGAEQGDVAA